MGVGVVPDLGHPSKLGVVQLAAVPLFTVHNDVTKSNESSSFCRISVDLSIHFSAFSFILLFLCKVSSLKTYLVPDF